MEIQSTTSKFIFNNVLVSSFKTNGCFHVFLHLVVDLFQGPLLLYQASKKHPSTLINTDIGFYLTVVYYFSVRLFVHLTLSSTIMFKLSTNARLINPNNFGNIWLIMTCFKQRLYSLSFIHRELAVVFHLCTSFFMVRKARSLQRLRFFYNKSLSCT